ncbi:MAG: ABC transporter ATP-binding protein [Clostridia bacterium]|nr:ABC transporter ATP-binding protein [Clostridia bacterium]
MIENGTKNKKALHIEDLSKNFGGLNILDQLSMSVTPGERRAIIGPNGAGKTTLFNVISGELKACKGSISLFGEEVIDMPNHQRARRGLARSYQKNNLFLNLSVLDNLALVLQRKHNHEGNWFKHRSPKAFPLLYKEAESFLESWNLAKKSHVKVAELSYGEQREIEILLGVAADPKILLLDEPTAGMSVAETQHMLRFLENFPVDMTMLIIEHDMEIVFGLADRITVLYYGKVLAEGTPEEIRADSRVREVYLGSEVSEKYA